MQKSPAHAPLHPWEWPTCPWTQLHPMLTMPGRSWESCSSGVDWCPVKMDGGSYSTIRKLSQYHYYAMSYICYTGTARDLSVWERHSFFQVQSLVPSWNVMHMIRHLSSRPPCYKWLAEHAVHISKNALKKSGPGDLEKQLARFLFHYQDHSTLLHLQSYW